MKKEELRSTKAYQRFLQELKQHEVDASSAKEVGLVSLDKDQVDQLKITFHKIKGTAGFFGLENLSSISSLLEEELREAELDQFIQECREILK